jgi:hypothetical protein
MLSLQEVFPKVLGMAGKKGPGIMESQKRSLVSKTG